MLTSSCQRNVLLTYWVPGSRKISRELYETVQLTRMGVELLEAQVFARMHAQCILCVTLSMCLVYCPSHFTDFLWAAQSGFTEAREGLAVFEV